MPLKDISEINIEDFNDDDLINNLDIEGLKKLASLATNAEQLNKVAHARNVTSEIVTAIMANTKVELYELDPLSMINLAKQASSSKELYKIEQGINVMTINKLVDVYGGG